jgi:hypothetical protein
VAVRKDWKIVLFDIKTFFLYGELPEGEEFFFEQFKGYEIEGQEKKVCKAKKALYGYPAAAHHAQRKLNQCFKDHQFVQSSFDPCMFVLAQPGRKRMHRGDSRG